MITVNETKLAAVLGLPEKPQVMTDHERRAARAITDSANQNSVADALKDAAVWTEDAWREGFEAGKAAERDEWRARITKVFGL